MTGIHLTCIKSHDNLIFFGALRRNTGNKD